jgi:N-glycosylase/DNA lyase
MIENTVDNQEKITFQRYFKSLNAEQKKEVFRQMEAYVTESHFYWCMRNNKYSKLLREKIETLTNKQFNWDE